jgi:hypothetical protein
VIVATFLVIMAIVAFTALWYYLPRSIGRGAAKVMYKKTNAKAMDEIYTIMSFTAPAEPAALQRAVDEHLGLAHDIPPVLGKLHISEISTDRIRVALGSKLGTEWTGVATFHPDTSGGTTGTYQVTNWTLHDRVVQSTKLIDGMTRIRERIAAAVTDQGGSTQSHLVPATQRK